MFFPVLFASIFLRFVALLFSDARVFGGFVFLLLIGCFLPHQYHYINVNSYADPDTHNEIAIDRSLVNISTSFDNSPEPHVTVSVQNNSNAEISKVRVICKNVTPPSEPHDDGSEDFNETKVGDFIVMPHSNDSIDVYTFEVNWDSKCVVDYKSYKPEADDYKYFPHGWNPKMHEQPTVINLHRKDFDPNSHEKIG